MAALAGRTVTRFMVVVSMVMAVIVVTALGLPGGEYLVPIVVVGVRVFEAHVRMLRVCSLARI